MGTLNFCMPIGNVILTGKDFQSNYYFLCFIPYISNMFINPARITEVVCLGATELFFFFLVCNNNSSSGAHSTLTGQADVLQHSQQCLITNRLSSVCVLAPQVFEGV